MMEGKVKEIIKEIEGMEKNLLGMFTLSDLSNVDEETMKMLKSYLTLYRLCKELMIDQSRTIDNMTETLDVINNKIDLLLNNKN